MLTRVLYVQSLPTGCQQSTVSKPRYIHIGILWEIGLVGKVDWPFVWGEGNEDVWLVVGDVVDADAGIGQEPEGDDGAEQEADLPRTKPLGSKEQNHDAHCNPIYRPPAPLPCQPAPNHTVHHI